MGLRYKVGNRQKSMDLFHTMPFHTKNIILLKKLIHYEGLDL